MTSSIQSKKIIVTHPAFGTEMKTKEYRYIPFKTAIIQGLKVRKGKTFTELTGDVVTIIRKKSRILND